MSTAMTRKIKSRTERHFCNKNHPSHFQVSLSPLSLSLSLYPLLFQMRTNQACRRRASHTRRLRRKWGGQSMLCVARVVVIHPSPFPCPVLGLKVCLASDSANNTHRHRRFAIFNFWGIWVSGSSPHFSPNACDPLILGSRRNIRGVLELL